MSPARHEPLPGRSAQMRRVEQKHAYENSVAVLSAFCAQAENADGEVIFDLASADKKDESARALVTEAVQYLEWRSLLERSVETPSWVLVLAEEQSEVAA